MEKGQNVGSSVSLMLLVKCMNILNNHTKFVKRRLRTMWKENEERTERYHMVTYKSTGKG